MRSVFNIVLAFMLGAATLAACEKITAPAAPATSTTPSIAPTAPAAADYVDAHLQAADASRAPFATPAAAVPLAAHQTVSHLAPVPVPKTTSVPARPHHVGAATDKVAEAVAYKLAFANAARANALLGEHRYRTS